MNFLPDALKPLAAYKQFTIYKLIPRPDGGTDKLPCDFRTGKACSWTDPAYWTNSETAIAAAANYGENYGVGFVLTEHDPFFLLDIDDCLIPGIGWSPTALGVAALFPGICIEVSQSGTGWHLIGSGRPPAHGCRNDQLGLEFYHSSRHIALTGINAVGDANIDYTATLLSVIPQYFPPVTRGASTDWTDEACEGWNGPDDDDVLISRALRSQSPAAAFGKKASFADLWTCNIDKLSECYPDAGKGYNESQADAALAQHLAFWTGNNCERIERLMEQSSLLRDKYDRKDGQFGTYLRRTIVNAVSRQFEVLTDKALELPVDTVTTRAGGEPALVTPVTGNTFVNGENQSVLFAGCVYVQDIHKVLVPGGRLLKPDQFKVEFGGYTFTQDNANIKTTKDAWEAFTQNQSYRPPKAKGTCFKPQMKPGELIDIEGDSYVNSYWPVKIDRKVGDASRIFEHMRKILPDEHEFNIMLYFMAACVQHQGVKFQWAPLLQGTDGNGKTALTRYVAAAIGKRYTHWVRPHQLTNNFNSWLVGKTFYAVEDIKVPGEREDIIEILKPMITGGDGIEIESKGVDQGNADICGNFIFNSNHKDAIRKTLRDRRFCVMYTAHQTADEIEAAGLGGLFFPKFYEWLNSEGYAIMSEFLHTVPIPNEYNPAKDLHRAPETISTKFAIEATSGSIEQEVMEALQQGLPGFRGGWISSIMLDKLLESLGLARRVTRFKRKELLQNMGYIPHPGLVDGRVNNSIYPDGGKPRLFVKIESPERYLTGAKEIAKAYEDSNMETFRAA